MRSYIGSMMLFHTMAMASMMEPSIANERFAGCDIDGDPILLTGTKGYIKKDLTPKQKRARAAQKHKRKARRINR